MVSLADFYGLDAWKRLGEESQVHNLVGVEEMLKSANAVLTPILPEEESGYNHLSVRSAVAISLDRLLGERGK